MSKSRVCLGAITCWFVFYSAAVHGDSVNPVPGDFARVIRADDLAALRELATKPGAANTRDSLKSTPLHYAAIYGSAGAVRVLLSAGADPNGRNESAATPLIYAAWSAEKTRLLVESDAKINVAQKDGYTPLMVAASAHGNLATVRYLIDKGADVRAFDQLHGSAFLRSAMMSDPDVLKLLIANGADPHIADDAGFNALHNATNFPDDERIRFLLAAGADPNGLNTFGGVVKKGPIALIHLSPLMLAAPYSDSDTIAALLKAGARVNEADSQDEPIDALGSI